ncbi:MAG TPA: alpha-ketoacid dehydrogenase subunit beta, partial [Trueperaceae bacterium]|nr:alpha-ketoacid dehydrogenase subunit beta [Trueperaceae bacterium]
MPVQNIVKTIANTLDQEMELDPSILVLGQDVGKR